MAIIDAARSVFEEVGFERASMSEISKRLGGSKATLYSYFASKEELFVAAIEQDIATESTEIVEVLQTIEGLREKLLFFGREYFVRATGKRPIAIYRMVANQPQDSGIGLSFYELGLRQGWIKVCLFLESEIAAGRLRKCNAWVAAMHLKGMLEGEFVERRMLNALPEIDEHTTKRVVEDAVDAFLRAYGAES